MKTQFTTPMALNGAELVKDLTTAGIIVTGRPEIDGEGVLWLDIAEADEAKATPIVAAHNGTTVAPDNSAAKAAATAKLAALGLTTDDLKALGLGTN